MILDKISPGIPQIPHHPEFRKLVYGRVKVQESQDNLEGNQNNKFIYYKAIIIRTMCGISQVSLLGKNYLLLDKIQDAQLNLNFR